MTSEATILLAVLAPVGAAILALGGKLLERHLKLIDKIEERMNLDAAQRREDRAVDRAVWAEILKAIGLEDKLDEIVREVRERPSLLDVNGSGRHGAMSEEDAGRLVERKLSTPRPGTYSKVRR